MDDIKKKSKNQEFEVTHISEEIERAQASESEGSIVQEMLPEIGDKVKIRFGQFVRLIATHNFEKILKDRDNDEVIVSADLLAEIASSHDDEEVTGRASVIFLVIGLVVGSALMYALFKF